MSDLFIGKGERGSATLALSRATRHGLIAGATGTGKTVTLQVLAEQFSAAGVPVFAVDVKGDLSGIAASGQPERDPWAARAREIGIELPAPQGAPAVFWDLWGENGHPLRTTVSEMGPLLLSRLLGLNETQEGVLAIAFRHADDEGLLLLDLRDLRALLTHLGENSRAISLRYGAIAPASVAAIQRALLQLEDQGGALFFGEPALDVSEFLRTDRDGRGVVSILDATRLFNNPRAYATVLLWLLSELWELLPEAGDLDRPKLIFFFDEAHLLFEDAPPALADKIEQVVRLIRSKGVGIFFVTQSPADVPDRVSAQLGNRIVHALRAYSAREQRAVKAVAETFRVSPGFDAAAVLPSLRIGEALVSTLGADGAPTPADRVLVRPPASRVGPIGAAERDAIRNASPVGARYDQAVDRHSAEEMLRERAERAVEAPPSSRASSRKPAREPDGLGETVAKEVGRAVRRQLTNRVASALVRGVLGGLLGGRRR